MTESEIVCAQIPFFDDVGAMTLQYFDSLFQRDNLQKSQFFKGLPKVLPKLPKARAKICTNVIHKEASLMTQVIESSKICPITWHSMLHTTSIFKVVYIGLYAPI